MIITCRGCGAPLLRENERCADGCPCNSPRGVNHGVVPKNVCTCVECDPEETGSVRTPSPSKPAADKLPGGWPCPMCKGDATRGHDEGCKWPVDHPARLAAAWKALEEAWDDTPRPTDRHSRWCQLDGDLENCSLCAWEAAHERCVDDLLAARRAALADGYVECLVSKEAVAALRDVRTMLACDDPRADVWRFMGWFVDLLARDLAALLTPDGR